jgi:hypothetical protein
MFQAKATATSDVNNMYVSRICLRGKHVRDGQNKGSARQYRNKTVCVGFTERISVVSTFHYYFVGLRCVMPAPKHCRLCSVILRMKARQNGELVRFSKQRDY